MQFLLHPTERRPRLLWRLLLFVLIFIGVTLLIQLVAQVITGGAGLLAGPAYESVLTLLIFGLAIWLAGAIVDRRRFSAFGLRLSHSWWRDLGFGLLLGALLMTLLFVVQLALGWIEISSTFAQNNERVPFAIALLQPVLLFVCVGIYEELLVRGYLFKNVAEGFAFEPLGNRGGVIVAYLFTSILFGVLHATNPGASLISTINIALAGFVLGLGMLLTGELAIPIGMHITWNFFQGNVFGMPVSGLPWVGATVLESAETGPDLWTGGVFGPEAGLMSLIALALGVVLTLAYVRRTHGRVAIADALATYRPAQPTQPPQPPNAPEKTPDHAAG